MKFPKWNNKYSVDYDRAKVIELSPEHVDAEGFRQIPTLEHNPAFRALMAKLKLQRGVLEAQLKSKSFSDIREVDKLQAGLFWCNWLESMVKAEVYKTDTKSNVRNAFEYEDKEFNRMFETLEVIK